MSVIIVHHVLAPSGSSNMHLVPSAKHQYLVLGHFIVIIPLVARFVPIKFREYGGGLNEFVGQFHRGYIQHRQWMVSDRDWFGSNVSPNIHTYILIYMPHPTPPHWPLTAQQHCHSTNQICEKFEVEDFSTSHEWHPTPCNILPCALHR